MPDAALESVHCNLCSADDFVVLFPSTLQINSAPGDGNSASRITDSASRIPSAAFACTDTGYGHHPAIVRCRRCGLVYSNPRLNDQTIISIYQAVADPLYQAERDGRVLTFERHLRSLERLTGPAAQRPLLDIGCYTGVFVEVAAGHGWDASGIDPSHWAVTEARARGLPVAEGTPETIGLPPAHFTVITLWDVIEHVTDPTTTVQQVYHALAPGGWLVIHTIDIESWFARLLGARWPWLMEMHIYYFSPRTLRDLLEKHGFQVHSAYPQPRYLRLGYLGSRIAALAPRLGRLIQPRLSGGRLAAFPVSINLGDLFTLYARKV